MTDDFNPEAEGASKEAEKDFVFDETVEAMQKNALTEAGTYPLECSKLRWGPGKKNPENIWCSATLRHPKVDGKIQEEFRGRSYDFFVSNTLQTAKGRGEVADFAEALGIGRDQKFSLKQLQKRAGMFDITVVTNSETKKQENRVYIARDVKKKKEQAATSTDEVEL
jgi:hypothetical protein